MTVDNMNSYILIGATSWGEELCTSKTYPGVYANITNMMDWITETTGMKEGNRC